MYFRFGGELLLLSLPVDDVDDDDDDADDDDEAGGNAGADAVEPVSLSVSSVPESAPVPVLAAAVLLLSESCSLCSA